MKVRRICHMGIHVAISGSELPRMPRRRTSENSVPAKFAEIVKSEVQLRRIPSKRLYEKSSNSDEPSHHETNHRSVHERFAARTKPLVIFAHPPVLVDPSDRPLHHPPTR